MITMRVRRAHNDLSSSNIPMIPSCWIHALVGRSVDPTCHRLPSPSFVGTLELLKLLSACHGRRLVARPRHNPSSATRITHGRTASLCCPNPARAATVAHLQTRTTRMRKKNELGSAGEKHHPWPSRNQQQAIPSLAALGPCSPRSANLPCSPARQTTVCYAASRLAVRAGWPGWGASKR